jgi:hypothetical protein
MEVAMKHANAWLRSAALLGLLVLGAGCDRAASPPAAQAPAPPPAANAPPTPPPVPAPEPVEPDVLADWLGKWIGPEGTSLTLSRKGDGFDLVIESLDGPAPYVGRAIDGGIEFERNGRMETLRATDGAGTGMKWLADKTDCLVIAPGEGFCRD